MCSLFINTWENCLIFCLHGQQKMFIKEICSHIADYIIQLVTTGNPISSHISCTMDKTYHRLVIAHFSLQILQCALKIFSYVGGVLVTMFLCTTSSSFDDLFHLQGSSQLPQKHFHNSHKNKKWLKRLQSQFH